MALLYEEGGGTVVGVFSSSTSAGNTTKPNLSDIILFKAYKAGVNEAAKKNFTPYPVAAMLIISGNVAGVCPVNDFLRENAT